MPRKVVVIPSAHRLMQSLRDIGYELSTAVADLIDNSIAADATEVRIDYEFEGLDTWIRIADNGKGMNPETLDEALRFGSRREYGELELGKFGLGLKTASLSQCSRLTVATRTRDASKVSARQWDLDHVKETDAWELLRLSPSECHPEAVSPLRRAKQGTVIFWERLERLLGYELPAGKHAQNGFIRMLKELEDHLAMVFHRFLSGEAKRALPLSIYLNGNKLEPWDPFARHESKTHAMRTHRIAFEHEGVKSSIRVAPFVLPHESQFSSMQSFKAAAGPKKWNSQQGFYIYRNDRMLQSGGWNRIRATDEHVKLARIAVDFPPSADTAFKINVSKMGINFPAEVRDQLTEVVKEVTRKADEAYRRKEKGIRAAKPPSQSSPPTPPGTFHGGIAGSSSGRQPNSVKYNGATPTPGTSEPFTRYSGKSEPTRPAEGDHTGASPGHKTLNECPSIAVTVVNVLRRVLEREPIALRKVLDELSQLNADFQRAVTEEEREPS